MSSARRKVGDAFFILYSTFALWLPGTKGVRVKAWHSTPTTTCCKMSAVNSLHQPPAGPGQVWEMLIMGMLAGWALSRTVSVAVQHTLPDGALSFNKRGSTGHKPVVWQKCGNIQQNI